MTESTVRVQPHDPATGKPTDWLPSQGRAVKAMVNGPLTDICIAGGHGSGKSEALAAMAHVYAWTNPGAPILLLAQTSGDMENVMLPKFLSYLPAHHEGQAAEDRHRPESMSPAIKSVELVKKRLRLKNGTMVYWGSADAKKSWEGLTVAGVFCDEIRLWDEDTFVRKARSRARDKRGPRRIVSATTPAMNWLDGYAHSEHVALIHADTRENVHLVDGYADSFMAGMSEQAIRVYVKGEFLPMSGQVYPEWGERNVVEREYDPSRPTYLTQDFGYRRPAIVFWQENDEGEPVLFDEIVVQDRSTVDTSHMIVARDYSLVAACVDPAGDGVTTTRGERDIDEMRKILRKVYPNIRIVFQTDPKVRAIAASVDILRGIICDHTGRRRLWITHDMAKRRYPNGLMGAYQSLAAQTYPQKKGGYAAEKPVKDGVSDHFADAIRYMAINFYLPRSHSHVIDIGTRSSAVGDFGSTDYNF